MTFFSISSHVLFEVAEGMKVIEFNEVNDEVRQKWNSTFRHIHCLIISF